MKNGYKIKITFIKTCSLKIIFILYYIFVLKMKHPIADILLHIFLKNLVCVKTYIKRISLNI
jgi:hypothetical protein